MVIAWASFEDDVAGEVQVASIKALELNALSGSDAGEVELGGAGIRPLLKLYFIGEGAIDVQLFQVYDIVEVYNWVPRHHCLR